MCLYMLSKSKYLVYLQDITFIDNTNIWQTNFRVVHVSKIRILPRSMSVGTVDIDGSSICGNKGLKVI